jgi:hypothetical protein
MQMLVDEFGERPPDSVDLREIIDSRAQYALQTTELLEELAPPCRAEPGNGFKSRLAVAPRATAPMGGDREAVSLVAHALHEMQHRRFR